MSLISATIGRRVANVLRHNASRIMPSDNLARLRALGRPHGVDWLRGVLRDNGVERLSELSRDKIDALIAGLERDAA